MVNPFHTSGTVSGSDKDYHYLRDDDEIFPEKHIFQNRICKGCGMVETTSVTGTYIVKLESIYLVDNLDQMVYGISLDEYKRTH